MRDAKTNPPLKAVYRALLTRWGEQNWWPARTRFETITGAILTQNTSWKNVEMAIKNLKALRVLSPRSMHALTEGELTRIIRPAGTFNIKAKRLKNFTNWLFDEHAGSLDRMFARPPEELRVALLNINGIGPETADCILLSAGGKPVFVVDAYTRRVLNRHGWIGKKASYSDIASLFEGLWQNESDNAQATFFNEYHALLVKLAKEHCRIRPECGECPLKKWLPQK